MSSPVLSAVQIVLSIFLMIGIGMLLTRLGWLKDEHEALLSRLVTRVALPGMIVNKLFTQFDRESLIRGLPAVLAPLVSLLLTLALALGLARLARVARGRRGAFCCMFTFSNSVFIGLPVSQALFGDLAIPSALLYYIANTVLFWSVGYLLMGLDGSQADPGRRLDWRKLFPAPLLVFLACAALVLLGVPLPKFVADAAKYVGDLVTPLSMLFTGLLFMRMRKSGRFRWQKGYGWMLLGRFVLAPGLLLVCAMLFRTHGLTRDALLIQAAMPVMSQTPIVATECGSDAEYAAGGVLLTTLCSLVFIPAYMAILPHL